MADPITVGTALAVGQKAAAVTRGLGFLRDRFNSYQQKKAEEWWRRIVEQFQGRTAHETEADVEAKFHDLAERDYVLRALNQSWRSVMDSLDDAVLPPLAALTAEYLAHGKAPDSFYRGMCRVLSDLTFDEYAQFQMLVAAAMEKLASLAAEGYPDLSTIELMWHALAKAATIKGISYYDESRGESSQARFEVSVEYLRRLGFLLTGHGVARTGNVYGQGPGFEISPDTLRRIHVLINSPIRQPAT